MIFGNKVYRNKKGYIFIISGDKRIKEVPNESQGISGSSYELC